MNIIGFSRLVWGALFRLFPCPVAPGLYPVLGPGRDQPVLVTCNFDLSVRRLVKTLKRAGVSAWVLVADSRGVNVWCAAGAGVLDAGGVAQAVKNSGIAGLVDHRRLILPPLAAPGVKARQVERETGFSVHWGPVRAADIPAFLAAGGVMEDHMRRVTYTLGERLDTALGSTFPFFLLGALLFALFWPGLAWAYLAAALAAFLFFFGLLTFLPGKGGVEKIILPETLLGLFLGLSLIFDWGAAAPLGLAMALLLLLALELDGLAPDTPAALDAALGRLGIKRLGNTRFAGGLRIQLLAGKREIFYQEEKCIGCGACFEVCPLGLWRTGTKAEPGDLSRCTACTACLNQCPSGAIRARVRTGPALSRQALPPGFHPF